MHASPHSSLLTSHRWLITGGAGFIGCNLIKRLVAEGVPYIRVLDNLSVGSREGLRRVCAFTEKEVSSLLTPDSSLVDLVVADIRDPSACLHAVKGVDVIVHLAANTGVAPSVENPRVDMETNVIGTLNMLEAARVNGAKRFIFASSGAPVGECEPPIHEELVPHPVSPYGASKLAGEGYCSAYYRTFGVNTVCLRFGNVYGPLSSHKSSVVAKFIRQALAGEICEIYGDGNQTRDFIYVDDLVDAIVKVAHSGPAESYQSGVPDSVAGQIFQIATNKEHTVNEVIEILRRQLHNSTGLVLQASNMSPRVGDVRRNFSDTSKARRFLNWGAMVRLDQGIARTLDWFLENRELLGPGSQWRDDIAKGRAQAVRRHDR